MRHGLTTNNVLAKLDKERFLKERVYEPELADTGVQECLQVGEWLRTQKIHIDSIYTSAHKRAVLSAKQVKIGYQQDIPMHLMLSISEAGGVYQGK
mgnify:CR=1 FL=1